MATPTYEYSGVCYTATADQTTFALTTSGGDSIGYLRTDHIQVRTSVDDGDTWTDLALTTDWTFADPATSIVLNTGVAVDTLVDIRRNTPMDEDWIVFQVGSLLTAGQLNEFETWQLYIDQELSDLVGTLTAPDIDLADTDDLPEGSTNLYYTDARVEAYVSGEGYVKDLENTDDLPEGSTNLYYTDARVETYVSGEGYVKGLENTDDLLEGSTNLYYTDARVESYISGEGYIKDAGVTKIYAGSGVALSPTSGIGEVTISAAGGGGGGFDYKGEIDATGAAPVDPANGDLYVNTATSGTVGAGWTGIAGDSLSGNERLIYSSGTSTWAMLIDNGVPEAPDDGNLYGRGSKTWKSITIPSAPVQSDWGVTNSSDLAFIKNKPAIPSDPVQSNWDVTNTSDLAFIKNKPAIPSAPVQSDWDVTSTSDLAFIKNKPAIPSAQDLQSVCDKGSVTTTKIQAAGFRVDQLISLP